MRELDEILNGDTLLTIIKQVQLESPDTLDMHTLVKSRCVHEFGYTQIEYNKKCLECWTKEIVNL